MRSISLVRHDIKYAEEMSVLSSAPQVRDALGLSEEATTIVGTKKFIEMILADEKHGKQYSRVILNEQKKLIGVITLNKFNYNEKTSHIGTWIGHTYWGKGYNELAKACFLKIAFTDLGMEKVFAGANKKNIRSQKAQEKLPYVTIDVGTKFPEELQKIEKQVGEPCILNVIAKDDFLQWYQEQM